MYYALQPEPERARRALVLAGAAVVALAVQGGALLAASRLAPPERAASRPIEIALVAPPPPPKPAPPPKADPPQPAPEPPRPKAPPVRRPAPRPVAKAAPAPAPAPVPEAPAPTVGLSPASTVATGGGPVFALGDTVFGAPARVAAAPAAPAPHADAPIAAETGGVRVPARLIEKVEPVYPSSARAEGRTGEVIVQVRIDADGRVVEARVAVGLSPALDEAALDAARRTRWAPATVDGAPVPSTRRFSIRFELEG
jgi:protein TonB